MAAAVRDQVGIALTQANGRIRKTKAVGEDLRKGGFVALADGLRAGDQRYRAIRFEADVHVLVRRAAGAFDVVRITQAAQLALRLAARRRRRGSRAGAGASARSKVSWKCPLSTLKPSALVIGIDAAGTMLRRRSWAHRSRTGGRRRRSAPP